MSGGIVRRGGSRALTRTAEQSGVQLNLRRIPEQTSVRRRSPPSVTNEAGRAVSPIAPERPLLHYADLRRKALSFRHRRLVLPQKARLESWM